MILHATHLTRLYRQGDSVIRAVDDASLTVEEGDFIAITGPSGCGKSTLLGILGGLDRPEEGEVLLDGESLYDLSEDHRADVRGGKLGFVFQRYSLLPTLSAEENIRLACLISGRPFAENYRHELCQRLGIEGRMAHFPASLSGGEQQRVAVARALITRPRLIYMDEPTGSLDRSSAESLLILLAEIQREWRLSIVMVTHDDAIARRAPIRYHMENGRLHRT